MLYQWQRKNINFSISLITGWTVYTEKISILRSCRTLVVSTERTEVCTKDQGLYIFVQTVQVIIKELIA